MLGLAVLVACTRYEYLVEEPDTPLYASEELQVVVNRLPELYHEEIDDLPEGDPVKITYQGQEGYVARSNLSFFSYRGGPFGADREDRDDKTRRAIRSAILRDQPWPSSYQAAIEEDRVLHGMTYEMVEMALGLPDRKEALPDGGSRWIYLTRHLDVHEEWIGGGLYPHPWFGWNSHCGPYWGVSFQAHPTIYRTYIWSQDEQLLEFDAKGRLVQIGHRGVSPQISPY